MAEVKPLRTVDGIAFTLFVTDGSSWIEGVKKIDAKKVQLPTYTIADAACR